MRRQRVRCITIGEPLLYLLPALAAPVAARPAASQCLSDRPFYPAARDFTIRLPDLRRMTMSLHGAHERSSATLPLWMMGLDSREQYVIGPSPR